MRDAYNRNINYLRISLTDRCNFRCLYCMPSQGVKHIPHQEILTYEELVRIVRILSGYGVNKVRLTGGEPLVRKGIVDFVQEIAALRVISDIAMTTNGSLLSNMADDLKRAGLDRVNISLDTIDPERFHRISGGGDIRATLQGIEAASSAGLNPVKLNVVVTSLLMDSDLSYFVDLANRMPVAIRFIEYMPIGRCGVKPGMSIETVKEKLALFGQAALRPVQLIPGNGPAQYFQLPGAEGTFGFITPLTNHFCATCNRIRLTADGKIKPCLLSDIELDVKTVLRSGASDHELAELLAQAIWLKPSGHSLCSKGTQKGLQRHMSQIGG